MEHVKEDSLFPSWIHSNCGTNNLQGHQNNQSFVSTVELSCPHTDSPNNALLLLMLLSLSWLEHHSGTFELCVCVLHIFENYVSFLLLVVTSLLILYINTRTYMPEGKQSSQEAINFGVINCGRKKCTVREIIKYLQGSPMSSFRGRGHITPQHQ